jgi:hypothetical protein
MGNLKELQDDLFKRIIENRLSASFVKQQGGIKVSDRLSINRNTVLENLTSSLRITYPGIWRLIGDGCARGASLAYLQETENLVGRHNINSFGENFPTFLGRFQYTRHLDYLPEFAKLEWLCAKSYEAVKEDYLRAEDMQEFFVSFNMDGKFIFNASVFFLQSKFPLENIQNLLDDSGVESLDLKPNDTYIVVCRVQGNIETLYLTKNRWEFLHALSSGNTIGEAIEYFSNEELQSELIAMVQLLISKQMIKAIVV